MKYPETRKDPVVDLIHGTEVPDPYRWLENSDDVQVQQWTEQQNALTKETLAGTPGRDALGTRLAELLSMGAVGVPRIRRSRYFYARREGSQNQPILYFRDGAHGDDRLLVDPASFSPDGASALDWWFPSPDGKLLAYGISLNGSEKSTLRIRVVDTGEELADEIPHTRYTSLAWLPDASGFYYTRYPEPGSVPEGEENYWRKAYFHALGTPWKDDPQIFGGGRAREDMIGLGLSPDGRWLVATVHQGWAKSELYVMDRQALQPSFLPMVEGVDALFLPDVENDAFYVRTNEEAPRYRLFRVDPEHPARDHWTEIVPQGEHVLDGHGIVGGHLVCEYLRNAASFLQLRGLDGALIRELKLPAIGAVSGWSGESDIDELFYGFVSFTVATRIYRHELTPNRTELWKQVDAPIAPDDFEARQVWYPSKDGTQISMFIVHRKGLELDGERPTLLYGYGGFNISLTPGFVRGAYTLLERDGVYAVANLRGGGEYGEDWHRAGMLANKQNVFDDCIAAAQYLIDKGYTRPERLAVMGGSNGGLLVGAVTTQRPDLFRAAVCAVPLLDMVRYHKFRIARLWISEYGDPEIAEQFRVLHTYSPYHRVRDHESYPSLLITAAESDTRVDPLHARKWAARLQAAQAGER
ncbi:MAG: prolyl oligopeptidase family serine peptidase, partial [Actinomycetota bacterium]